MASISAGMPLDESERLKSGIRDDVAEGSHHVTYYGHSNPDVGRRAVQEADSSSTLAEGAHHVTYYGHASPEKRTVNEADNSKALAEGAHHVTYYGHASPDA
ncbi:MAG: hypothetical protein L6R41_002553 [Letrouitia leprolyta]|nr:MAG: hypothetical protein L6R41_002553 [Letrouitia leprolyta]